MFPNLEILGLHFHTNTLLVALYFAFCCFATLWQFGSTEGYLKSFFAVLLVHIAALFGSRLLHVAWERPTYYANHLNEAFTNLNGMVLYGGIILAGVSLSLMSLSFRRENRPKLWDLAAVLSILAIATLRVGCFANGCCWGSICRLPWAVSYFDSESSVPFLGIPLHPVQLYEAAGAFGLCAWLLTQSKRFEGQLIYLFFTGYGLLRFTTEFFRGDDFRGINLLFGLSTSQLISIALIAFGFAKLAPKLKFRKVAPLTAPLLLALLLAGCLPEPPDSSVVKSTSKLSNGLELITMNRDSRSHRNLLLVASDDEVQQRFAEPIRKAYKSSKPIRIEELSWWLFAPKIRDIYDRVVRIPHSGLNKESLFQALTQMESMGQRYDLFLLTHGVPNNIVSTRGQPLISFKDLGELKGQLPKLQLVFNQACFGDSLIPEWQQAGARAVISYSGLNRNFFYLGFFLKNFAKYKNSPKRAFSETNSEIDEKIAKSRLYSKLIETMGMSVQEYLARAPNPKFTKTPATH